MAPDVAMLNPLRSVVRQLAFTCAIIACSSTVGAQSVSSGTIAVSGITGISGNRQSIQSTQSAQTTDAAPQAGIGSASDVGFTSVIYGLEASYFVTPSLAIGAVAHHERLSIDAPTEDAEAKLVGAYYGALLLFRLPIDTRTSFTFAGSIGGSRVVIVNRNTGFAQDVDVNALGNYWLAGGGLNIAVTPRTTVDAGIRYQRSSFHTPDAGRSGKVDASGLLVSVGFSVYFR